MFLKRLCVRSRRGFEESYSVQGAEPDQLEALFCWVCDEVTGNSSIALVVPARLRSSCSWGGIGHFPLPGVSDSVKEVKGPGSQHDQ